MMIMGLQPMAHICTRFDIRLVIKFGHWSQVDHHSLFLMVTAVEVVEVRRESAEHFVQLPLGEYSMRLILRIRISAITTSSEITGL